MKKVLLPMTLILLTFVLLGCSKSHIDMSYLKTPSSIDLINNKNDEINSIKKELKKLDESGNKNEEFITKIINKIKSSPGSAITYGIKYESNNAIYNLHLNYSDIEITEDNIEDIVKEGYVFSIWILEDGKAVTAKYDLNSPNKMSTVGIVLDNETLNYIKEYYNSNILK
ncbi:hypothetical protein [Clostridium sp. JNZ J1-5]